jgi:hypothetical protein
MIVYICKTKYDFNRFQLKLIKNGHKWHNYNDFFNINNAITLKNEGIKPTYQIYVKDKIITGWDCNSIITTWNEPIEIVNVDYRKEKLKRILHA